VVAQSLTRSTPRRANGLVPKGVGATGLTLAHGSCLGLFLTLPWGPHWPFGHFGLSSPPPGLIDSNFGLADLFLIGLAIGWSLALIVGGDSPRIRPLWISIPLLLFAFSACLAVFPAFDRSAALHFAVRIPSLALLYFFLSGAFAAGRLTTHTVAAWLAPGIALNGCVAVLQTIHQNPIGLTWLAEPRMLRTTPGTAVILVHGVRVLRAFGVLPHANVLGGLLSGALPLVAAPLFRAGIETGRAGRAHVWLHNRDSDRRVDSSPITRLPVAIVLVSCVVLTAAGVVLSFSRSSWVGLAAGIFYVTWWGVRGRRSLTHRALMIGAGILLVTAGLLLLERDAVLVRLRPESNRLEQLSLQERLALQTLTLNVIAWRPLTGVGGNNDALAEARFLQLPAKDRTHLYPVHNTYLLAQAELGPIGSGSWLALMLIPFIGIYRRQWRKMGLATALAGSSLVVVAVAGLFDYFIWTSGPVALLWITALARFSVPEGESARYGREEGRDEPARPTNPDPADRVIAAIPSPTTAGRLRDLRPGMLS
jgi:O-antigen ligase